MKAKFLVLWGCCAAAVFAITADAAAIAVYQTAKNTTDRVTRIADLPWQQNSAASSADATLRVDVGARRQEILGFGAAFTEAAAWTFAQMPAAAQEELLHTYFDSDGPMGGYSLGRIPIASCDFTLSTYSHCDKEGDYSLETFDSTLSRDSKYILPLLRKALARSKVPLKLLASPWSPPAWMKKAHAGQKGVGMNGSAYPTGMLDDEKVHAAWALYFKKWLDAFSSAGVDMWAVTVQNEPQAIQDFESCLYTRAAQRSFIVDHLGPTLRSAYPKLKILAWDHNKNRHNTLQWWYGTTDRILTEWVGTMFGDDEIKKYVDGIALHWYQYSEKNEGFNFDLLETSHAKMPNGTFMLGTEACTCGKPNVNNWDGAELYGIDIAGDLSNWVVGWTDWNMLLTDSGGPAHIDGEACEAPLIYEEGTKTLHVLPKIYYLAHFARFIRPGSTAVNIENSDSKGDPYKGLSAVAAVTPEGDSTLVVVVNPTDTPRTFTLVDAATSRTAMGTVPAHAIQTLVYN